MSSTLRPERLAAAARAAGTELAERVAIHADALTDTLAHELSLVAWDREQLVGQLQVRLQQLRDRRFREYGTTPVRVVERRAQPLESIDLSWMHLRQGCKVHLEYEAGASTAAAEIMRGIGSALRRSLGQEVVSVADGPWTEPRVVPTMSAAEARLEVVPDDPGTWPVVGVAAPGPRVAVIGEHGDRELAAYVLARASLRRSGTDPRGVKFAYVSGPVDRLRRHLGRLWVGAQVGPASDHQSFAGPVDHETRDAFLEAHAQWEAHEGVEVWAPGGVLSRADSKGVFLAPALFGVSWPVPKLPVAGPMLVTVACSPQQCRAGGDAALRVGGQVTLVDRGEVKLSGNVQRIRGALLVERLPAGLPEPRPV